MVDNIEKDSEIRFKRIFDFFLEHYAKKEPFKLKELQNYVQFDKPETLDTYISKRLQDLLIKDPSNPSMFFIRDNFKLYSRYEVFRNLISQRARLIANYSKITYDKVLVYEFYLPMANERILKSCLDNLFYEDTIKFRLKTIPYIDLERIIKNIYENSEEYFDSICKWISKKFFGYSIETVSGRFRAVDKIMSYAEAGNLLSTGNDYLIDETTAIVRFIFPIEPPLDERGDFTLELFDKEGVKEELDKVWFFFERLFVESILEIVNGEDQIWMIERRINKTKLHIWKVDN